MGDLHGLTNFTLGCSAIAAGRFVFGLDWVCAIFLYFPASGLSRRILANDGKGIVKFVSALALYPFVTLLAPFVLRLCLDKIKRTGNPSDEIGPIVLTAIIVLVLLLGVFVVASFIANCFGRFSFPAKVHAVLTKAMLSFTALFVMVVALRLMQEVDARYIHIPHSMKMAFSILFVAASAFMLTRVFLGKVPVRTMEVPKTLKPPSSVRLETHPDVKMSDVVGMDKAKEQIRLRLIEPVRNPDRARRYGLKIGGGVLLYGPPGTGKTMLARAVAGELNLPFYMITSADVFGKYVGESERNIKRIFDEARKNPLSVVFIDELETLFPKRTSDVHETTRKVISLLLQELDGLDTNKNPILLLGATNVPWMVDEAFLRPGRFDVKVFVDLPDADARRMMLSASFANGKVPREHGLTAYMAERTAHYSGADLNGVMDRIRQLAYARNARCYNRVLADEAIASVTPSANGELVERIKNWEHS